MKGILLLSFLLLSCSQSKTSNPVLEVRKDQDVHYEGTNDQGVFDEHITITDPKSESYEEGMVTANRVSSVQTIVDNGLNNRIDLVLVGDGYTSLQLSQWAVDAQNIADKFFNQEPLNKYRSYFNVHRVDVMSNQSGVDNDTVRGVLKSTALDMTYWCSGIERLLCGNIQKIKEHAAAARDVDQILAIANSAKHGGAGYWNDGVGTLAARNPASIETAIHEFGHIFGKLGDEYSYAGASTSECLNKTNGSTWIASEMLTLKRKWWRWLDLPHVDAFKGTCYSTSYYRPTADSKMRTLGAPFYEVNSEQMILEIYRKIRPIDSATAPGIYPKNRILRVATVHSDIDVRWYIDGKEILAAAQKRSFSVASVPLPNPSHTITVKVIDKTSQVRDKDQRRALMTESRSWTIQ